MGVAGSEPQMSVNDGISTYGNITSFAESILAPGCSMWARTTATCR